MLVSLMTADGVQYPLVMEPLISSPYHLMEVRERRRERERERGGKERGGEREGGKRGGGRERGGGEREGEGERERVLLP